MLKIITEHQNHLCSSCRRETEPGFQPAAHPPSTPHSHQPQVLVLSKGGRTGRGVQQTRLGGGPWGWGVEQGVRNRGVEEFSAPTRGILFNEDCGAERELLKGRNLTSEFGRTPTPPDPCTTTQVFHSHTHSQ